VIPSGIMWVEGATRFLATKLRTDARIEAICLNRKSISDDEGNALFLALAENKRVRKVQLDGNQLGPESLKSLSEMIKVNDSIQ